MIYLFFILWLISSTAHAEIAIDTTSSGEGTISTSHSHTFAAGSIAIICPGMRAPDGTVAAVSSVTVDGSNATLITAQNEVGTAAMRVEMWYHLSPGTGSKTVAVTYNASTTRALTQVISLTGVAASSVFGAASTAQASNSNVDINSIASAVGELGIACGVARTNTTTASADATSPVSTEELETSHTGASSFTSYLYSEAGAATSINMLIDLSVASQHAAIGVSVRPLVSDFRKRQALLY